MEGSSLWFHCRDPLTRIIYVVWPTSAEDQPLAKAEVEKAVDDAPPSVVKEELGYDVFRGKTEPKPPPPTSLVRLQYV